MFSTSRQRSADPSESWYGEPQHESGRVGSIGFERYGEANHEQPAGSIEFIPEIEYRPNGPAHGRLRAEDAVLVA